MGAHSYKNGRSYRRSYKTLSNDSETGSYRSVESSKKVVEGGKNEKQYLIKLIPS